MSEYSFKYHPDPLKTGAFESGETVTCDCCAVLFEVAARHIKNNDCYLFKCLHCGKHFINVDFD